MPTHHAIAIDGPAASGKSTVAQALAERLGILFVNSGAMYRAVTWWFVKQGYSMEDEEAIRSRFPELEMTCDQQDGRSLVAIDGQVLGSELRSEAVHAHVSKVARVPEVRAKLVAKQREYLALNHLVMEGRDIGTVVFPETPFKFFVTASEAIRQQRRQDQGQSDAIGKRDQMDSSRKASPLKAAEDALVIDTSALSQQEVVEALLEGLATRGWKD
ncbi:MAG: (d)CMP kinase [Verrucomicrobiota bacterium]